MRPRRAGLAAALALLPALLVAGCATASHPAASPRRTGPATIVPQRILRAPRSLLGLAGPQPNGTMWALAGRLDTGLFRFDSAGQLAPGPPVSNTARSVAVSPAGVLALAMATRHTGALELLSGATLKPLQTVALPAPARQVATGPGSPAFFVLTAWSSAASVTIVGTTGVIRGTVPVPSDAVSVAPDPAQGSLYVLEKTGLVDQVTITSGKITSRFRAGDNGRAIAISPAGGTTLYVLKGTPQVSNIAVVDAATESVRRVLPAPSYCRGLLVSPSGDQLYEVVGTSGYGNIQVVAL